MDKRLIMNAEVMTCLVSVLSRQGIEFCAASVHPSSPPTAQTAFAHPFYPLQQHSLMEFICRLEGAPAICINGRWSVYDHDKVKAFIPGTGHTEHYSAAGQAYKLLWGTITDRTLVFHLTAYAPPKGYFTSNKRLALSPPMCRKLWDASIDPSLATSPLRQAELHCLLMEALCFCIRNSSFSPTATEDFHQHVIDHLKAYIEDHYWENLTLKELAGVFHYSPKHLNALFKQATGTPLLQYVSALRMQKARELLASGAMLIKQVAEAVGIHDPLYFSRKFRRHFGRPPLEFTRRPRT
jgi:AraC-like DNA-binding protein